METICVSHSVYITVFTFLRLHKNGVEEIFEQRTRLSTLNAEKVKSMFGMFDGLKKVRDCRFSCVNIKKGPEDSESTDNGYCGSGFILYWDTFTPLREKLKKTFEHQIQDDKFTDFQFLVITNYHVVEVGTLLGV